MFGKNGREKVVCFDADSGQKLWEVDSDANLQNKRGNGPRATPAVLGERVFTIGALGSIMCLDVKTGKKIWSLHLNNDLGIRISREGLSPSPLIHRDKLFVMAGPPVGSILALDKDTGKIVWKALNERINHSSPIIVAMGGARHLVALTASNVVGLSLHEGRELWRRPMKAVNIATPIWCDGGGLFLSAAYGYGCQFIKLSMAGDRIYPEQVYKKSVLATHHATAVYYKGYLYGSHDRRGPFKCIKAPTGEEMWSSTTPGKGKAIITDCQLIVLNEAGYLFLAPATPDGFSPTSRARLLRGPCYTAPTLANGKLYARNPGELLCLNFRK